MDNKLSAKDLINVGIFTAIYLVVFVAVSMLGYIPIFVPLLSIFVPLSEGIPFMLFLTRVKKFGMVSIMSVLCWLSMCVLGAGWPSAITGIISGLLADWILKTGGYQSAFKSVLSHGVFSMWIIGNYIPMFITRDAYFNRIVSGYGQEYAEKIIHYLPNWSILPIMAMCFVSGILGAQIGKSLLKKHFVRAGIA